MRDWYRMFSAYRMADLSMAVIREFDGSTAEVRNCAIDDNFIKSLSHTIPRNSLALFLLKKAQPERSWRNSPRGVRSYLPWSIDHIRG